MDPELTSKWSQGSRMKPWGRSAPRVMSMIECVPFVPVNSSCISWDGAGKRVRTTRGSGGAVSWDQLGEWL